MKSGYRIKWTDNALSELKNTFIYIEQNWSSKELSNLSFDIEKIIRLISNNPEIFPVSNRTNVRKAVIKKSNTLYYREKDDNIVEILSFFSNRQNPDKRKI